MPEKDELTFTLRVHDPKEKKNAKLAASWAVVQVPREAFQLSPEDFAKTYVLPAFAQLEHFKKQA